VPAEKSYTVFACESQPILIEGLRQVFASSGDLHLIGSSASPCDTLHEVAVHRPDLVLLDQSFGASSVLQLAADLSIVSRHTRVLVWINTETSVRDMRRLVAAGVRGLAVRTVDAVELLSGLRRIAGGGVWSDRSATVRLQSAPKTRPTTLTSREAEIARCVFNGMKNKEIGGTLAISERTVKIHLTHIFKKAGVRGRAELASAAGALLPGSLLEPPVL
jgi:DNA-binding NarL/FixJ family response regulator